MRYINLHFTYFYLLKLLTYLMFSKAAKYLFAQASTITTSLAILHARVIHIGLMRNGVIFSYSSGVVKPNTGWG